MHVFSIGQETLLHIDRLVQLFKHSIKQIFDDVKALLVLDGWIVLQDGDI